MFSLIEEPDDALEAIEEIVAATQSSRTHYVRILHGDCQLIDYEAGCLASALALEASRRHNTSFSGDYPSNAELRDIVAATGMPYLLEAAQTAPDPKGFTRFGLVHGQREYQVAVSSSRKEIITTELTTYVNECLSRYGFNLGPAAEEHLSSLVSEVIGNAEEHSGRRDWWIGGYLRQKNEAYGDCHIAIFNLGKTLCESLQVLPSESLLRTSIEALVSEHASKGFFGGPQWTEENLWTLYALQEGVSRRNTGWGDLDIYGQGTADMIDFFQRLGQSPAAPTRPKMCLVSGRTHITFDGRYRMVPQETGEGEVRRIIAFNKSNDLREPPDADCVRTIKKNFPGTLIGLRFYIDPNHLRAIGQR